MSVIRPLVTYEPDRGRVGHWNCIRLLLANCPFTVIQNTDKPIDLATVGFNFFHAEITLSGANLVLLVAPIDPQDIVLPNLFPEITLGTITAAGSPWRIVWGKGSGVAGTDGMVLPYQRFIFRNNTGANSIITVALWADFRL